LEDLLYEIIRFAALSEKKMFSVAEERVKSLQMLRARLYESKA
jgi:hypothetical protein